MKKLIIAFIAVAVLMLVGCEEGRIVFEGTERPVSEVEEILGDKLEVENPGLDLDVDIYEDSED